MAENDTPRNMMTRRRLLAVVGAAGAALSKPAWPQGMVDLPLPGGPGAREITTAFTQKGPMILQRTRPPLLETPFEVFDGVFTPNDQFTYAGTGRWFRPRLTLTSSACPCAVM
jgi:hypothetical protein